MEQGIVIKIGGSLVYDLDNHIREVFFKQLAGWLDHSFTDYSIVVIVVGGGTMSRFLVEELEGLVNNESELHRIGMKTTQLNAQILSSFISEHKNKVINPDTFGESLEALVDRKYKYIVTGGYKEGWSSDMNAAIYADVLNYKKVYKLSNVDYIYSEDPNKSPDVTPITDMSWDEYFTKFNIAEGVSSHTPGLHVPIGAYAAQFAAKKGLAFFLSGGKSINNKDSFTKVFETGTFVHP
jgi:uridylate kinase